jgi:hypothetical protein
MMFRRLRRAYHEWRIKLLDDDIARTQDELLQAFVEDDKDVIANSYYWIERLKADKRIHEYRLAKIPQPT